MKRIEQVHEIVRQFCNNEGRGSTTSEVAKRIKASRQNVSSDLNRLWREGILVKTGAKPVVFWDKTIYEKVTKLTTTMLGEKTLPISCPNQLSDSSKNDPFAKLVGYKESLHNQVEQAKAAILYPPLGLHTLLVGPTGVGKSLFAELMYRFGLKNGRLPPNAPLVTLNCADYANNPQLLLAHLFGAAQGSFTGADKDKAGLVERADGGILFLDEVHRLSAEGQETLFRLLDKGLYRRLGETGKERQAQVMLIAATTEWIDSALLHTFTRRIPMVISLPSLANWTLKERLRIIRRFFKQEATKINTDIRLSSPALKALLSYECLGNIGQLRSDVQLACARGFLRYLTYRQTPVNIELEHLPEHVHRTLPRARNHSPEMEELTRQNRQGLYFHNSSEKFLPAEEEDELSTFYDLLEQQVHIYQEQGLEPEAAERLIALDIESHFHDFVEIVRRRYGMQRQELSKLVDPAVLRAVDKAIVWAEGRLRRTIPERTLYALVLHVNSNLERLHQGHPLNTARLFPATYQDSLEYQVATEIICLLSKELSITLPQTDVNFITLLLHPEEEASSETERIGIVVMAHGRGVATGMVEVAHSLTGMQTAIAIDMSLDDDPNQVQEQLIELASSHRYEGGLLLLADMGSLENMGQILMTRTGLSTRTVGMISSPLVVEAVHQASMPGCTLELVYRAVLDARYRALVREERRFQQCGVILTCCFTGEGSALTLANVVREALGEKTTQIEVISASIGFGSRWDRLLSSHLKDKRLLAVVGPINPQLTGIPYISTEEFVVGSGIQRLVQLVNGCSQMIAPPTSEESNLDELIAASLSRNMTFTNPRTTVPAIAETLAAYTTETGHQLDDELRLGLLMHVACLIERRLRDQLVKPHLREETPPAFASTPYFLSLAEQFYIRFTAGDLKRIQEILSMCLFK